MSLINDVLNELEKSRDEVPEHKAALMGMAPAIKKQQGAVWWKLTYWLIILAIAVGITWHYHPRLPQLFTNLSTTITTVKNRITKIKQGEEKTPPVTPAIAQPQTVPQLPMVRLQQVTLEQKNNQTILDYILSAPTSYYIEHGSEQQLFITLNNTNVLGNLPVSLANSFIFSLNTTQNKSNIVSLLTLLPGTKIDELQLIDKPQPHIHLVLSNPQLTTELTKGSLSKVPTQLTPEEQKAERYREIRQFLAHNEIRSAIQKLHLFVGDYPNHTQARITLVSLLIKEGRLQKADDILTVAFNKFRDYPPFIKLKAHILIKENRTMAAIDLLQQHFATASPSDVEYFALLAALYQQHGSYMAAAGLYNQLTKIQPQKTSWWLGLGVALENAGKTNAAREAYRHAYNSTDVPPELSAFLNDKINK